MRRSLRAWCWAVVSLALVSSCNELPVELPEPTTLSSSPGMMTLTITDVSEVTAQVLDQNGVQLKGATPLWTSENSAVVRVANAGNGAGTVTAVAAGTAKLTATFGGLSSSVDVTVVPPTISAAPTALSMTVTNSAEVTARVLDAQGAPLKGAVALWVSDNPAVVRVTNAGSGAGTVTAVAAGTAKLTASFGGVSSTVDVTAIAPTVTIAPATMKLTITDAAQVSAQVVDAKGAALSGAVPVWASDNPAVARVTNGANGAGTVNAMAAGTAKLTASFGGASATIDVTVTSPAVLITPRAVQLFANQTQTLFAKVSGDDGQDVSNTVTITWSSLNQSVATLTTSSGNTPTVVARTAGTTSIVAATGTKADTIPVTVVTDARSLVSKLTIIPDTVTFDATQAAPLEFEYRVSDANGNELCAPAAAAPPVLGFRFNTAIITTASTSATLAMPNCRIRLSTITGQPGGTWLYASVNSVTDSVFVHINRIAYTATFTKLPAATPVNTIRAGDTVQYEVTVLDEASQPAANVSVGFDVTGGSLSARSVTTNASGVAAVSWYLPRRTAAGAVIPPGGAAHTINFRLEFPSGGTGVLTASNPVVTPGPTARVVLLGNFAASAIGPTPAVDTIVPTSGTSCTAATCTVTAALGLTATTANLGLFVQSFDRFNNPRISAASFTANDPSAMGAVGVTGTVGNASQAFTTLQADRARTDTITIQEGAITLSVRVNWTAGTPIIFQPLASNQIWTGQASIFTTATGIPGDTMVYSGGAGTAAYPTKTMRADTVAFAWTNGGFIDVGLVASNGTNSAAPVSAIPATHRATTTWGFAGFQSTVGVINNPAGGVVFLSDRDAAKIATTGAANMSVTTSGYNRAVGSFVTDGFAVGQRVNATGFTNAANNGVSTITAVTATDLTVTKTGGLVVEAAPGFNGRTIVASNASGASNPRYWDLYIRDRNSGNAGRVTNTSADSTHIVYRGISISPDGQKALIVSDNFAGSATIGPRPSQVYEVTLSNGTIVPLTTNTNGTVVYRHAQYSPDGSRIYLDVNANGTRQVIERTGAGVYNVLKTGGQTGTGLDVGPSFDPANVTTLGYISTQTLQIFTIPGGANAAGRRNLQWFTWRNR